MPAPPNPVPLARHMSRLAYRFAGSLRVAAKMRRHGAWTDAAPKLLDVGTGRMLVLPVALWLLGCARQVVTVDVRRHLHPALVALQHPFYRGRRQSLLEQPEGDPAAVADRLDRFLALLPQQAMNAESDPQAAERALLDRVLRLCDITYLAPCDAAELAMPNESFDMLVSTSLLEHISPDALPRLLRNGFRMLRPGGIAVHLIDHKDHADPLARFDDEAPRFEFLHLEEAEWRKDSEESHVYVNRLRSSEYMPYFESVGFDTLEVDVSVDDAVVDAINAGTLDLASRFRSMTAEDVATHETLLVVRKPSNRRRPRLAVDMASAFQPRVHAVATSAPSTHSANTSIDAR